MRRKENESAERSRNGKRKSTKRKEPRAAERKERRDRNADKDRKRGNRQVIAVAYCVVIVFLGMIGYLVKFMVQDSQEIINNPANKRQ